MNDRILTRALFTHIRDFDATGAPRSAGEVLVEGERITGTRRIGEAALEWSPADADRR